MNQAEPDVFGGGPLAHHKMGILMATDQANLDRRLIAQAPDAIVFADTDGIIRIWNPAAEDLFGVSADEAIGSSLDLIVPEDYREPHWLGFHAAVERGRTTGSGGSTVPALHADGSQITIETSGATVVHGPDGTVQGVMNIIRPADS